jgi:small subunit ribosomal protein S3
MGRKVHPVGFRLKINRDWDARWYAEGSRYVDLLHEDRKIRKYIKTEAGVQAFRGSKLSASPTKWL